MSSKIALHLLVLAIVGFISCKKTETKVQSRSEILTSKAWVVVKAEEKSHTNPWVDVFPAWLPCEKDDKWIFKTDLSLEYNDAANPCSGNPPNHIIDIVTWAFAENETKLVIDGITLLIEKLENNTLILSSSETIGGIIHQSKVTLGH
jgi:hypothetical protein